MIGFSNETLARLPRAVEGQRIDCPHCGAGHTLHAPDEADRRLAGLRVEAGGELKQDSSFLFYRCGKKDHLGAVAGRLVAGVPPDVSTSDQTAVHAVCDECWGKLAPAREPVRTTPKLATCCWCGNSTTSGIYRFSKSVPLNCPGH